MIQLTIEIKETKETGIVAVGVSLNSEPKEATIYEKITYAAVKSMLSNNEKTVGHGVGETDDEALENALENSKIHRAILAAGREVPKQ